MSAGVPLYLVSACGSAEEFVAAFRRYADRTGLFVPVADPLPIGRRGRIALALNDGGVMIEGIAEVVASSVRPSGMYGRIGMTLKFVEPDEPSKIVIAELEKARLAMKPAPPSVPPRPAEVPAEPRAVPPPPGGRIDAANALAECVMIGDPAAFQDAVPAPTSTSTPPTGPGGKFVLPSIPSTGRPKTSTTPPALTRRTAQVPVIKPLAKPGEPAPESGGVVAPLEGMASTKTPKPTTMGTSPIERPPAPKDPPPKATRIGFPAIKLPAMDAPAVIVGARPSEADPPPAHAMPFLARQTPPQPIKVIVPPRPAGPPMPRQPTPFAPLPIVRLPAGESLADDPEKTDLTDLPIAPVGEEQRKTSLGVAIVTAVAREPSERTETRPPITPEPTEPATPEPAPAGRSGGMRASEIMAAIQGEDWTMTPDAPEPKILPATTSAPVTVETMNSVRPTVPMEALDKRDPAEESSGPAGDWTMSVEPNAADGWTPPAKVELPVVQPATGNRVLAVASAEPLNAVEWEDKPTGIGEPLVQIDPTLMPATIEPEPAHVVSPAPRGMFPLPPPPRASTPPPIPMAMPPPIPRGPQIPPPLLPGSFATPMPDALRMPGASGSMPVFGGAVPPDSMDSTSLLRVGRRRTRIFAIAIAVLLVGAAGAALALFVFRTPPVARPTQPVGDRSSGSASALAIATTDAAPIVEAPVIVDAGPAPCKLAVDSVPDGAEVWLDTTQLGVTPAVLDLPCGVEAKLQFKKAKVGTAIRTITPDADTVKLTVRFAPAMVSLRVTSTPPGATIVSNGKVLGITPTTVRVPANGAALTLTKDGYTPDTERVAPKPNATHHVNLKKLVKTQKLH